MSDVQRDKAFYDMADAYIALANTQLSAAKPSTHSNPYPKPGQP